MLTKKAIQYNSLDIKYRANGLWADIFSAHGVDLPGSPNKHGPCPACGGVDRFRFDDKNGDGCYICSQCDAGDGFSLLMKCFHWTFPQALEAVAAYLGASIDIPQAKPCKRPETPTFDIKKQQRIDTTLANSERTGLPLDRYFINRGLSDLIGKVPSCLRFHPGLPYWQETASGQWEQSALCPTMLGLVTDLTGNVITLHRTFLTNDGNKAPVPHPKKLIAPALSGSLRGSSIKLATPTNELCLTEGIETALAVWLDTSLPTWACVSANLLEQVNVPPHIKHVHIMADKDRSKTGEDSSKKLAYRLMKNGHDVRICLPPGDIPEDCKSLDWLDVFCSNQEVKGK
jgi:putative DNA primase/helicase